MGIILNLSPLSPDPNWPQDPVDFDIAYGCGVVQCTRVGVKRSTLSTNQAVITATVNAPGGKRPVL